MTSASFHLKAEWHKSLLGALAFDFGMSHIGVAIINSHMGTVEPMTTVPAKNGRPDIDRLVSLVDTTKPTEFVVGLPLHMDDSESKISKASKRFGNFLSRRFSLPVHFVDERLTSREARDRSERGVPNHAIAAAVIGESWLHESVVKKQNGDQGH